MGIMVVLALLGFALGQLIGFLIGIVVGWTASSNLNRPRQKRLKRELEFLRSAIDRLKACLDPKYLPLTGHAGDEGPLFVY
jgi:uncharacterized membrane-anchored protein YhcB (DUF1043 family)